MSYAIVALLAGCSSKGNGAASDANLLAPDATAATSDAATATGGGLSIDAGPDQRITLPTNTATFTAIASDSNGYTPVFSWSQRAGGAATPNGASTPTLTVTGLTAGAYVFRVTVSDGHGASVYDDVALTVAAGGTNYYFSSSQGDDSRTATQAHDPSTPWRSITKLNALISTLQPGDSVLFARGDVFNGSVSIDNIAATMAQPIVFGAYGTGAKPLFSSLSKVAAWTNVSGNIWQSTTAVSTLPTLNIVVVDGTNTAMGREPNTGYNTFSSHVGQSSITDATLTGTPNWTGAELVLRPNRWTLERHPITAQSGGTLTYTSASTYTPIDNFGYFIQNSLATLDTQGEWYFDPSTGALSIYSAAMPVDVEVPTTDVFFTLHDAKFFTFDNLAFAGANSQAFQINGGNNVIIQNSDFSFMGAMGIHTQDCTSSTIQVCTFANANGNGIGGNGISMTMQYNTISNVGVTPGMSPVAWGDYTGITWRGDNSILDSNHIDGTGADGIFCNGNATLIQRNVIRHVASSVDDAGAIYTSQNTTTSNTGRILDNIVSDGVGAPIGTNSTTPATEGIYLDDNSNHIEVAGNRVANMPDKGIFVHNGHDNDLHDNTSYNNLHELAFQQDNNGNDIITNNVVQNNIFVAGVSSQDVMYFISALAGTVTMFGTADNNTYARPLDDDKTFTVDEQNQFVQEDLVAWQAQSGQDLHSKKSPTAVTSMDDLRYEFNDTTINKTVTLDGTYIDVTGASYAGTITLAPYTAAVLIRN